jgi:hypothetical protein
MAGRLFGRYPFLLGLAVGGLLAAGAGGTLLTAGVVGTEGLDAKIPPQLFIWDTQGETDRTLWKAVRQRTPYRFARAHDVYVETGYVRITYAGSEQAPTTFTPEPLDESASDAVARPQSDPSFPAGPADLRFPNSQQAYLRLTLDETQQKVVFVGALNGLAWNVPERPPARIDLLTFRGPWSLRDESGVLARGAVTSRGRTFEMSRGHAAAFTVAGEGVVAMTTKPARLVLEGGGAGGTQSLYLEPEKTGTRVYVGALPTEPVGEGAAGRNPVERLREEALAAFEWLERF